MENEGLYTIGELARAGGVSRRTVRYYVQEGLLPAPLGLGRGGHYGPEHLDRLLRIKTMQEQGMSLYEIRRVLSGPPEKRRRAPAPPEVPRTAWTRVELAEWCRRHFRNRQGEEDDDV